VAVLADDDVIVHGNAEQARHRDNLLRHLDVGARRRRVAGRMIVHQDDGGRRKLERPLDHVARIDRRMVDGVDLLLLSAISWLRMSPRPNPPLIVCYD